MSLFFIIIFICIIILIAYSIVIYNNYENQETIVKNIQTYEEREKRTKEYEEERKCEKQKVLEKVRTCPICKYYNTEKNFSILHLEHNYIPYTLITCKCKKCKATWDVEHSSYININ